MDPSTNPRTRVLTMPSFDTAYEDIPPVLPPLQDFTATTIPFSRARPSPLEPRPNGRVNLEAQSTTTPLSSRQKALAQAKPIESGDPEIDPRLLAPRAENAESGEQTQLPTPPDPEQARKKAKLRHNEQIADFVHLPQPQPKKAEKERLPPLRPIAELNEPPSGAARFPPITPRGISQHEDEEQLDQSQQLPKLLPKHPPKPSRRAPIKRTAPETRKPRVYTRERLKWTEEETDQLVKGLAIYGMGRWKHILDHPEFEFHPGRTHVDLKDRCRVLFPPNEPQKWVRPMPVHVSDDECEQPKAKKLGDKPKLRKRKQAWTEDEDEELNKGFKIHGYQWEKIARDESLRFDNRTGSNIRDRFRLKYPDLWAEARPVPSAPPPPKKPQGGTKGAGSRGGKGQRSNKKWKDVLIEGVGEQRSHAEEGDDLEDIAGKAVAASRTGSKDANGGQGQGQGPNFFNDLLNEDWDGPASGGITLPPPPPVRWEDMAVQTPMFDLG